MVPSGTTLTWCGRVRSHMQQWSSEGDDTARATRPVNGGMMRQVQHGLLGPHVLHRSAFRVCRVSGRVSERSGAGTGSQPPQAAPRRTEIGVEGGVEVGVQGGDGDRAADRVRRVRVAVEERVALGVAAEGLPHTTFTERHVGARRPQASAPAYLKDVLRGERDG